MVAGDVSWGQVRAPESSRLPPPGLRSCERMVVATVHLSELLLAASGLLQRLGAAGVRIDVLVAAASDEEADRGAGAALDELRVPGLQRHRLALPVPISADRGDDLLAAMSELVGFAPEPGVYCLAPAAECGVQAGHTVVAAAAQRISRVYRLPLLRFTTTPDTAVVSLDLDTEEWTRKCAALATCATQVTPLTGRREYFGR